ncbi:MAG: GNAT family N-acetyltransferase [Ignavibacteriaceae bacterium]
MTDYRVKITSPHSKDVKLLTEELYDELELIYEKNIPENFLNENLNMLKFILIYSDNKTAVACGALKHLEDKKAEIKRLYVKKEHRGKGLSKIILNELEKLARKLKYEKLVLETGNLQPEALSLYKNSGYTQIDCYGWHASDPDSVCFEKKV